MPWNSTWPVGTSSVRSNKTTGQANTAYIEAELNKDHFFNIGNDEDGHHKFVQAPKYTGGTTPTNPDLDTGMDGAYYLRQKTIGESPNNEDVQPYFTNVADTTAGMDIPQFMQILGIRACATVNIDQNTQAITYGYQHNVTVSRNDTGDFTATFISELPSNDYLIMGDCMKNSGTQTDVASFKLPGTKTATLKDQKSVKHFDFYTFTYSGTPVVTDPITLWFVVFGG